MDKNIIKTLDEIINTLQEISNKCHECSRMNLNYAIDDLNNYIIAGRKPTVLTVG